MGKSSLLSDFALSSALRNQTPVAIFSLEMSRHEVVKRFLASEARVDSQRLNKGSLHEQDWQRLSMALGRLSEAPIFIDDAANISMMEMRAKCRRLKAKHGLGLVIIDYLQLMQSPKRSENRQQEVSEISRSLKILARELQVPVICASQLNRGVEYRSDKRPLLGDLRESGCLTGDTRVSLADGRQVPIADLVGATPDVVTLDGWRLGHARASKVWKTGHRTIYEMATASGRRIRATDNHPFLVFEGWKALGDLRPGDRIGIARRLPAPTMAPAWDEPHVILKADRELVAQGARVGSGGSDREMAQLRGVTYGGSAHFAFAPTRRLLQQYAEVLDDLELKEIATSDIYWDTVVSIEPVGTEDVYDMTVSGTHNFIADGIVCHNSIEQDADVVMFIYRDEVYNPDTEHKGEAELIVAKHRNGPTGKVRLAFMNQYTKFASLAKVPGH